MKDGLTTAGYCGLFCESCAAYIGTTQEPERLGQMAKRFGRTAEEIRCRGCRSDTLSFYCAVCAMKSCIEKKGLDFCSERGDYPCGALRDFQAQAPHRLELFESLEYVKAHGVKRWREKMERNYACAECGTLNAVYQSSCRRCGAVPPNEFVRRNGKMILEAMLRTDPGTK
jgi:hypothetical protein